MELVAIIAAIALLEYTAFVWRAGKARGEAGVPAPAMFGHPNFERHVRVQENTVEQLVIFLPALFMFAIYASELGAVALGVVFILGRGLYAHAYVNDPAKRGPGFALTLGANLILVLGTIVGALRSLI